MTELPPDLVPFFTEAGWYEGRKIPCTNILLEDHPAVEIVSQFGGLTVGENGPGQECARSTVTLLHPTVEDRIEAGGGIINKWSTLLKTRLMHIGFLDGEESTLYIATDGRCFAYCYIGGDFFFQGENFIEAMRRALFGLRANPVVERGKEEESLYWIGYNACRPEFYRYD